MRPYMTYLPGGWVKRRVGQRRREQEVNERKGDRK